MANWDVGIVVNLHSEGTLAHPTLRSLARSVRHAQSRGRAVEVVIVLDVADDATRRLASDALAPTGTLRHVDHGVLLEVANGDLGSSRNDGVAATSAPIIGTLDGDNLVSREWIHRAAGTVEGSAGRVVAHPEFVVIFEARQRLWPVSASTDPTFRPELLQAVNYWDAFCMARREVFEQHHYVNTHEGTGLGPEDWHWNCETLAAGVDHVRVPGSVLYYRAKRTGSLADRHVEDRSLLPPTRLLLSRTIAELSLGRSVNDRPGARDDVLGHVLEVARGTLTWPAGAESGAVEGVDSFNVAHYRLLNADLALLSYDELIEHYHRQGRAEGRDAELSDEQVSSLVAVDFRASDYVVSHSDLQGMSPVDGLRHYLAYGIREGRTARPDAIKRFERTIEVPEWLVDEWKSAHELEPLIQFPTADLLKNLQWTGHAHHLEERPNSRAYWTLVNTLPDQVDALFVAPWVRMGGGDQVLVHYIQAVAAERPGARIVLITTEPVESTHLDELPEGVLVIDLAKLLGDKTQRMEAEHLLATMLVQYAPPMMHVINSSLGFDTVEAYGRQIAAATKVFLSTFVIERSVEGELGSPLLRRRPGFLDHVAGVIVDHDAIVDQLHELYLVDRRKFLVHHQAGAEPISPPLTRFGRPPRTRLGLSPPPRILWTARFDRQKRLDVLADVAEALVEAGTRVELHFHGDAVIADAKLDVHLQRLADAGAVRHPPFSGGFRSLPLEHYSMFLITSEWEGIPLLLLDAASSGIPIVAPLVGGIPEVIDSRTGYLVSRFDAIEEYVVAIQAVLADPAEAQRRGRAAAEHVLYEFSWQAFEKRVRNTPGYLAPARDRTAP